MFGEMMTEFISVSKVCKNKNLSVRKVLDFLTDENIIPKASQRKHREFYTDDKAIKILSTGETLKVIENEFLDYVDSKDALNDLQYHDETTEILDTIVDPKLRFKRISEIKNKTLLFLDAEFKNGNYHEIAYELWKDGKLIEKDYFLERREFFRLFNKKKGNSRYARIKKYNIDVNIPKRKHINYILKKLTKQADYIIAHNAYGERNMLINNGLYYDKAKFLCTGKMSMGMGLREHPSLMEIIEFYGIKYDSHFRHYAFEDTKMARQVFFKMIETAEEKYNGC